MVICVLNLFIIDIANYYSKKYQINFLLEIFFLFRVPRSRLEDTKSELRRPSVDAVTSAASGTKNTFFYNYFFSSLDF